MKYKNYSRGFTLIELLVVVLVIGILAAVALPQYQKTIYKSRYATLKNLTRSLADAQEIYYLNNGSYALDLNSLDLDFPANTGNYEDTDTEDVKKRARVYLWGRCWASTQEASCKNSTIGLQYKIFLKHNTVYPNLAGQKVCMASNSLDRQSPQHQICQTETGRSAAEGPTYIYP